MTFFEQELRKIVEPVCPEATYVGRACYVKLGEQNRAKLQFVTGGIASHYDALQMTILNRAEGKVDTLLLRFTDLMGKKQVSNPNFREGVDPHIWDHHGKPMWYVYRPTASDYTALTEAVNSYLEIYQEQGMESQWQQTM